MASTVYLTCLRSIREASIAGVELENRRIVGAEVREMTRGKEAESCMALNTTVKTLVCTLKDMGNNCRILSRCVI